METSIEINMLNNSLPSPTNSNSPPPIPLLLLPLEQQLLPPILPELNSADNSNLIPITLPILTTSIIASPTVPEINPTNTTTTKEAEEKHFTRSRQPNPSSLPFPSNKLQSSLSSTSTTTQLGNKIQPAMVPIKRKEPISHSHVPPTPSSGSSSDSSRSTSPEYTSIPSFISPSNYLPSDDPDSSSDDEETIKIRPITYSRDGRMRPKPSYYYDAKYDPANSINNNLKKRGRRGGFKGIPVFEPTEEDFMGVDGVEGGGFYDYVKRIEKYGMRSGVVKVIPPKAWIDSLPVPSEELKEIRLREPISQHIFGSQGLYRVTNVAKTRIWNPAQWKVLSEEEKWSSPDFIKEGQLGERSERSTRGGGGSGGGRNSVASTSTNTGDSAKKNAKGKGKKVEVEVGADVAMEVDIEEEKGTEADTEELQDNDATPTKKQSTPNSTSIPTPSPRHSLRKKLPLPKKKKPTNLQRAEPTLEEWQTFMSTFNELPHGMKVEDYTIEMMREVERRYWRTLTFGEAPMYGADMKGSLFDPSTVAWNVAHLGDLLPRLAPETCKIPGVVSPYLYFGMWRATFAWHVEDADLYSINYIHFGAPKFWYSVPQEMSGKFERSMEGLFPTDRTNCAQFLRHKSFLASPRVLANSGITLNRVVQLPGEFILTYPKGYHSGFNLGFNCAESINFATEQWIPLGKVAKSCYCIGDSVNINVDAWLHHAALDEEREDAKDPTSALSIERTNKRKLAAPVHLEEEEELEEELELELEVSVEALPDIMEPVAKKARVRKPKVVVKDSTVVVETEFEVEVVVKEKKISKKAAKQMEKVIEEVQYVCALCPDMSKEGLVVIGERGKPRKGLKAHRVCVMFTPTTWIDVDPEDDEEIVAGFSKIERGRWKLKCQSCSVAHGVKFQCTKDKCARAYHITCALRDDSGAAVDATISSVSILEQARVEVLDSTKVAIPHRASPELIGIGTLAQPTKIGIVDGVLRSLDPVVVPVEPVEDDGSIKLSMLCRAHNPEMQRLEAARKVAELSARVNAIPIGSRILVKTLQGPFDVTLVAIVAEKESISFTHDNGKPGHVKWRAIQWPDSPEVVKKKEEAAAKAKEQDVYVWDDKPTHITKRSAGIVQQPVASTSVLPPQPIALQASQYSSSQKFPQSSNSQHYQYHPQQHSQSQQLQQQQHQQYSVSTASTSRDFYNPALIQQQHQQQQHHQQQQVYTNMPPQFQPISLSQNNYPPPLSPQNYYQQPSQQNQSWSNLPPPPSSLQHQQQQYNGSSPSQPGTASMYYQNDNRTQHSDQLPQLPQQQQYSQPSFQSLQQPTFAYSQPPTSYAPEIRRSSLPSIGNSMPLKQPNEQIPILPPINNYSSERDNNQEFGDRRMSLGNNMNGIYH